MFQDISQEWKKENEDIKSISEPISLDIFGLDRLERCLQTEFKILTFMTQTNFHVDKLYKNPEQFPFNRHTNFMAFNPTRVTLGEIQDWDKADNYINANFVEIEGRKVIATQGPLTTTFYNFWRAAEEYKVQSIFMLCNFIEKTKIKCDRYFPTKECDGMKLVEKQYQVILMDEKDHAQSKEGSLKIRKLKLINTNSKYQKEITHFQVTDWPDGDKPVKSSKKTLYYLLKEFNNYLQNSIPIVHCSAGVGRTGTFICLSTLKAQIEQGKSISVFEEVRKLKEQRWGLVHTLNQYQFLYDFAQKEINKLKNNVGSLSDCSSDQNN